MDAEDFDRLTKALGGALSRRGALGAAVGGLVGGLLSVTGDAEGKKTSANRQDKKRGNGKGKNKPKRQTKQQSGVKEGDTETCPGRYSPKGCPNPGSQPQYTCKANASGAGCGVDSDNAPKGSVQVGCDGDEPFCYCNSQSCTVNEVTYERDDRVACTPVRCDEPCKPKNKEEACKNRDCGKVSDGCDGEYDCGTCTGGQTCNDEGKCVACEKDTDCKDAGPCQTAVCEAGTCKYSDKDNLTTCETKSGSGICCGGDCKVGGECCSTDQCEPNESCFNNQCGCDSNLFCQEKCCASGEVCRDGGAGGCCKPTVETCPADYCGTIDDGCGNKIPCSGKCGEGFECKDNACVCPTSEECEGGKVCCTGGKICGKGDICCEAVGKDAACGNRVCGTATDSCTGEVYTCGTCPNGEECNAGGQCVATCAESGQTCSETADCCEDLVCEGGVCGSGGGTCKLDGQSCKPGDQCCSGKPCTNGICPPDCSKRGADCKTTGDCCGNLTCQGGTCKPPCTMSGGTCEQTADCCGNLTCQGGVCGSGGGQCAATGASCATQDCCDQRDTCVQRNGRRVCERVKPAPPKCAHAGQRPRPGGRCCERLHLERGRCVINRWDHCDRDNGKACERGTRCTGGRRSPHKTHVCVPKSKIPARSAEIA